MGLSFKIKLGFAIFVMSIFFFIKTTVFLGIEPSTPLTRGVEYFCFLTFSVIFWSLIQEYNQKNKRSLELGKYAKKLNEKLIDLSHDSIFYEGDINKVTKLLTKEVTESTNTDRCSIWLYGKRKDSITCQQLYINSEKNWYQGFELFEKDCKSYFDTLKTNPIIVANDALNHEATSCFTENYLKPLGINSMLDVPIVYKGETIGVICIESLERREWNNAEINFAQMLSSLYSFTYSIKDTNNLLKKIKETEDFIDEATLISDTDAKGRLVYANEKFAKVSGYSLEELIGKNHRIVNSGQQTKKYWADMYKKVLKGEIWNDVVTNKSKDGSLYYVDTYIRAVFDENGKLEGFTSIRQDITDIIKTNKEIEKKNTYLEHAAKILRHDMHSGINTYIPRGVTSLERRLKPNVIKELKLESPLKMIKEGLQHTQKVYKGVYEFTNLVKKDVVLEKTNCDLKKILNDYLSMTSYKQQVIISDLITIDVNESLFCTAIDNLIRNGLKYNDSDTKFVKIFMEDDMMIIQDNGRGLSQEDFNKLSEPYIRKESQKETGSGLGLSICLAILKEHKFSVTCEKNKVGTKIKIKFK
jgi:PAS domain S-box-containing protein